MKIKKFGKTFRIIQWKGERLNNQLALDTETSLIKSPAHTPPLVLSSAYDGGDIIYIITNSKIKKFLELHKNHVMIFHNFAFDMQVLTKHCGYTWWKQIETDKIFDSSLLYRLYSIATKGYLPHRYSLDHCVMDMLNEVLPKDNNIRLTFGDSIENGKVNYAKISKDHYVYAALDPVATYLIGMKLLSKISLLQTSTNLAHKIHLMGDIALADIHRNGIGVDLAYTSELRESLQTPLNNYLDILANYGYIKGKKGNKKAYKDICDFLELDLPKSPKKGEYSMSEEDLILYKGNPFVDAFLGYKEYEKSISFLNLLTEERVHPRYKSLMKTARTSCTKPNMQNPPRKGGIRECFIPAPGHVFCDVDYSSIEMYTMANILKTKYGHSQMFDVLQEGKDPHIFVASSIYNVPENEVTKDQRQASKIANYGFLANMSEATFVDYAAQFGADFTLEDAKRIKKGWVNAYPEIQAHWKEGYRKSDYISTTGFIRANCSYTEWLNTHFQGRAAEGAKIALYLTYKAGLKIVSFVHDQIVIESKKENAKRELKLLKECMIQGMKMVCDMNIGVDGEIKERYSK